MHSVFVIGCIQKQFLASQTYGCLNITLPSLSTVASGTGTTAPFSKYPVPGKIFGKPKSIRIVPETHTSENY